MDEKLPADEKNYLIPGSIVVAGMLIAGAVLYSSGIFGTPSKGTTAGVSTPESTVKSNVDARTLTDDDPILGDPNAPVTIVEFSDFQCPFCGRFWSATLPQIKEQYIKTGKAKLVYRDFPLSAIHENAEPAARAGGCAYEQGKFWEYHDLLFQHQDSLDAASLKRFAGEVGLDGNRFSSCFDTKKYAEEVKKDFDDGRKLDVNGTPAFFVNNHMIIGAVSFEEFRATVEQALAGK